MAITSLYEPAKRGRSVAVTKSGNAYTVRDKPTDEAKVSVTVQTGFKKIQLPNGLAYDAGATAILTLAELDQIPNSLFSGGSPVLVNNGLVQGSVQGEGTIASIAVAGADVDNSIANAATNQYTATVTYMSGDTEAFDNTNSVANGVAWAVVHVSGTSPVGTIATSGLFTAHAANDGTVRITATLRGVTGQSPILTVV